jgi:hypothetical protein
VAVGEETDRRGEVMVEVTVGRRLPEQWRGSLPAFAAGAGQPWRAVLLVQEREGALSWRGARRGVAAWFGRRRKKGRKKRGKRK